MATKSNGRKIAAWTSNFSDNKSGSCGGETTDAREKEGRGKRTLEFKLNRRKWEKGAIILGKTAIKTAVRGVFLSNSHSKKRISAPANGERGYLKVVIS